MLPISSGCAMRPSGMAVSSLASSAGSFIVDVLIGVATAPGPTPTTRMLCGASSTPAVRVNIRIPPFDKQYGGIAGHRPVLVDRGDIDDAPAAALLDHLLRGQLGSEERALQVDGKHFLVLRLGGIEHRSTRLDAGVVDHDVDAAECFDRGVDQLSQVIDLADVGLHADGPIPQRNDLLHQCFARLADSRRNR